MALSDIAFRRLFDNLPKPIAVPSANVTSQCNKERPRLGAAKVRQGSDSTRNQCAHGAFGSWDNGDQLANCVELRKCKPAIPICRATIIWFHHLPVMRYPLPLDLPWLLREFVAQSDVKCAQCGADIIAPEWSEHLPECRVRNVWSCEVCGYQFEDTVYLTARDNRRRSAWW